MKIGAAVLLLTAAFLAAGLSGASASYGATASSALRFTVTKRAPHYVVVERRAVRLVVSRGSLVVPVHAVPRYRVVMRTRAYYLLSRLPAPAANPVAAINNAKAGATVVVRLGTFTGNVLVPSGVTVIGSGKNVSWLQGRLLFRSNDSISGLTIGDTGGSAVQNLRGASSTTFTSCRFRGGRPGVRIDTVILGNGSSSCDHITFKDCDVERNLGTGDDIFIGENGSVATGGAHVDNVTFDRCHIGVSNGTGGHDTGSPRAGIEAYTYPTASRNVAYHGWSNVRILNCVIKATDGFCVDLADAPLASDPSQRASGPALISGCTLMGGGYPSSTGGSGTNGYTIESEAPNGVVIENNTIYRGSENTIQTGASSGLPSGMIIRNNVINMDFDNGIPVGAGQYEIVLGGARHRFTGNTVIDHVSTCTRPYGVVTLDNATACVMTGNRFSIGGRTAFWQVNGSSGNTLSPNAVK